MNSEVLVTNRDFSIRKCLPSWSLFKTVSDTQSRGILPGINVQEAYASGICWFTAWTDLGRFFKGMARGTRLSLQACPGWVSGLCFKIQNHERLSNKLVTREFQWGQFTAGGYFCRSGYSLAKPYTDENIISQHIAKGLCNLIYREWYLTPLTKSQFLWNSRPWEKLKEADPFLHLETLNPGIEPGLKQGRSDSAGRSSNLLLCSVPREPRASDMYIHSHLDAWVVVVTGQHAWWPHS